MGIIEMMYQNIVAGRDAKRNANLQALDTLRKLYPDQEVNDQNLLRGLEQEQQRVNPNFRMPRETSSESGVPLVSPYQNQLAPGEASPTSDAMVQKYLNQGGAIRAIKPPSHEMWSLDQNGLPYPTGKSIPTNAKVFENPKLKMLRSIMEDAAKQETHLGVQQELEYYRQGNRMEQEAFRERGRNARYEPKNVRTKLWANPETGEYRHLTEE